MRKNIIFTTAHYIISFDKCERLERQAKQLETKAFGQKSFLPNQERVFVRPFGTGAKRVCPQGLVFFFRTFARRIFPARFDVRLRPHYLPLGLRGWVFN